MASPYKKRSVQVDPSTSTGLLIHNLNGSRPQKVCSNYSSLPHTLNLTMYPLLKLLPGILELIPSSLCSCIQFAYCNFITIQVSCRTIRLTLTSVVSWIPSLDLFIFSNRSLEKRVKIGFTVLRSSFPILKMDKKIGVFTENFSRILSVENYSLGNNTMVELLIKVLCRTLMTFDVIL